MFHRLTQSICVASALAFAVPAVAQETEAEKIVALYDALDLPELLEVMRDEGLSYGEDIGRDLFPSADPGREWRDVVSAIYDLDKMQSRVATDFATDLQGDDLDSMLAFFSSEPGRTIIGLEISARKALLDDAVEEASKEAAAIALADEDPRMDLVKTYVETNSLIETNVVGALNSNFAFFTGLMEGGAFPQSMSEDEILADVWSQEPDIRANTTEWVYSFLYLAYQPLDDGDLEAYIAFSETEAGQQINQALFAAFDGMFEDISRNLGRESSRFMTRQEL